MAEQLRNPNEEYMQSDAAYWGWQLLTSLAISSPADYVENVTEKISELARDLGIRSSAELMKFEKNPETGREEPKALSADELIKKFGRKILRVTGKNTDGTDKLETVGELQKRINNGLGRKVTEDLWRYHERLDGELGARDAREAAESIFEKFSSAKFIEHKYHDDPEIFIRLARIFPWERFKAILDHEKVDRGIKIQMWQKRRGAWVAQLAAIQKKAKEGVIIEGGTEYGLPANVPYMSMSKSSPSTAEFLELLTWEVPVTDQNGNPYTKGDVFTNSQLEGGDSASEVLTFENMRRLTSLWQGTLSGAVVEIKDKKLFGATERRNIMRRKRKFLTAMRKKWFALQVVLGNEAGSDALPIVKGTVDLNASDDAREWADGEIKAMRLVVNTRKATDAEMDEARDRLALAEEVKKGAETLDRAIPGWSRLPLAEKDKLVRKARADLRALPKDPNMTDSEKKQWRNALKSKLIQKDPPNLHYFVDQLIDLEGGYPEGPVEGIPGWYKGKSDTEASKITGKRERHCPPMVYGLDLSLFKAMISGQDKDERDAFFELVLAWAPRSLVDLIVTNHNIMETIGWPPIDKMRQINKTRARQYPEEVKEGEEGPLPLEAPVKIEDEGGI